MNRVTELWFMRWSLVSERARLPNVNVWQLQMFWSRSTLSSVFCRFLVSTEMNMILTTYFYVLFNYSHILLCRHLRHDESHSHWETSLSSNTFWDMVHHLLLSLTKQNEFYLITKQKLNICGSTTEVVLLQTGTHINKIHKQFLSVLRLLDWMTDRKMWQTDYDETEGESEWLADVSIIYSVFWGP